VKLDIDNKAIITGIPASFHITAEWIKLDPHNPNRAFEALKERPYRYLGKVVDVYDADTVTIEIDLGFKVKFTEKFRLFGIDAWELRGEEREKGLAGRDDLRQWVLDKDILVQTIKNDSKGKYGRYLAVLWRHDWNSSINEVLVHKGHAEFKDY